MNTFRRLASILLLMLSFVVNSVAAVMDAPRDSTATTLMHTAFALVSFALAVYMTHTLNSNTPRR